MDPLLSLVSVVRLVGSLSMGGGGDSLQSEPLAQLPLPCPHFTPSQQSLTLMLHLLVQLDVVHIRGSHLLHGRLVGTRACPV